MKSLGAARPHGQDVADPRMRRALERLGDDPDARARIDAQQRTDSAHAEALQATPVPADLKTSLLKSMAEAAQESPPPRRAVAWPSWAALAAAVALLACLGLWKYQWAPRAEFARTTEFRAAMAYYIAEVPFQLDYTTQNLTAIRHWLRDSSIPTLPAIPQQLAEHVPLGCKEIQWGQTKVSLICFYESIPDRRIIHLFVAPRSALSEDAIGEIEATLVAQGFETKGWQTDEWVCVLVPSSRDMRVAPLLEQAKFVQPA